jgi:N-acetylmuramoyl-L-alanine amidase
VTIKTLLLLILFISFSIASDIDLRIDKSVNILNSDKKSEHLRALNDIKMIYLSSLMKDDKITQKKSLKILIRELKKRKEDTSEYEKEYNLLSSSKKVEKSKPKTKIVKKESKKEENNYLTKISFDNKSLVLDFSEKLTKKDIRNFQWTQKKYRDIYEIKGILDTRKNTMLNPKGISQIKIAQFEPNIIRVVFTDDDFVKTNYIIDGDKLIFTSKQITSKVLKTQKRDVKKYVSSVRVSNDRFIVTNSTTINNIKKLKVSLDNGQKLTIFEIPAPLKPFQSKSFNSKAVSQIKILRYNPTTTRVVFADKKPIDVTYKISNNKIFFRVKRLSTTSSPNIAQKTTQAKILKRNGKIIVIDPGHGGKDSGAIGIKKYQEKKLVFNIARQVRNILKKRGYTVYLTRYKDKFQGLKTRTKYANDKNADIFVSIHANSIVKSKQKTIQGIETFFLSPSKSARAKRVALTENKVEFENISYYSKNVATNLMNRTKLVASNKLAIDIQRHMLMAVKDRYKNVVDMGVRKGPFWILFGAMMPSILIEVGYITHPVEGVRLQSTRYQNLLSLGIANGIDSYFSKN